MAGTRWRETESRTAYNTALAAAASEELFSSTLRVENYNRLIVENADAVTIRVVLDGDISGGKHFFVNANGGVLVIEPESGLQFVKVSQTNLAAATAEVANTILFRVSKCEAIA